MIKIIKSVFIFSFLSLAIITSAQNNTQSPYSIRGLGEPIPFINAYSRALGGATNGIRSTRFASFSNPASISALKQVVFDFGMFGAKGKLKNNLDQSSYYTGNFNYFMLGFPIWQKEVLEKDTSKTNSKKSIIRTYRTIWSTAIGVSPLASMGSASYKTTDTTYGQLENFYSKYGTLSNFFIMNAVNVTKYFSVGINAGFAFGQISNNTILSIDDSLESRVLEDVGRYYFKGIKLDFGVQYQYFDTILKREVKRVFNRKDSTTQFDTIYRKAPLKFIVGGTLHNQTRMKYNYNRLALNKSNYYVNNPADTILNQYEEGYTYLPSGFSAGFSIRYDNLWLLTFDYFKNFYGTQKSPLFKDVYTNSSQYSVGLAYKPDIDVDKMNFRRGGNTKSNLEYRAGFRYLNTGFNFKDNTGKISPLKETGLSAGIGIPLLKRSPYIRETIKSSLNLTFEYIYRGNTKNGMIAEKIYKLTIGLTIGDVWFTKRRFN